MNKDSKMSKEFIFKMFGKEIAEAPNGKFKMVEEIVDMIHDTVVVKQYSGETTIALILALKEIAIEIIKGDFNEVSK